jgi:hypothetical protein
VKLSLVFAPLGLCCPFPWACRALFCSREPTAGNPQPGTHSWEPTATLWFLPDFAEKLLKQLESCKERFEVKMMLMNLISRLVGIHEVWSSRLLLGG